ncbi:ATP-binding protein [Actinoplanes sp. L3-i22]|uniref:ATP-binding protein n=1 Tax=Actinoplanes sp. L3-i22 TaxID=2836373 RepID=UPI001C74466F|nr:ATP-binding protein [Actinoplanes sp. L3-i22]BCY11853.1 hypothetical protein L3i22_069410 [Actinoplanes sp. L3-i22]
MTDDQQIPDLSPEGDKPCHGNAEQVWHLVKTYGPEVTGLCRAGSTVLPSIGGLGLSTSPIGAGLPVLPRTRFSSDRASELLEAAQHTWNEGPCRDAAATGRPVQAVDLTGRPWERRWPGFTPAALDAGVQAVLALPLHAGAVRHNGAVDLSQPRPGGFAAEYTLATAFAAATAELLSLERLELDWLGAFTAARRDSDILDVAGGATAEARPALASETTTDLPLARWFDRASLAAVRRQVHGIARKRGLPGAAAYPFSLAVHEAMANAVQHGGGCGQLLLWLRDDRLWCEISDHGPGIPDAVLPRSHPGHAPTGEGPPERHGLWIIERACTSLDIITDATGTRLLLSHRIEYLNGHHTPR